MNKVLKTFGLILSIFIVQFANLTITEAATTQCFARTTDNNDGKFIIELIDGGGQRTSDCKFTTWYFDTLSGKAKNIPSTPFDGYTLTFDDTLTGTIKIKVTEPTPFESTFDIGGSTATTSTGDAVNCYARIADNDGKFIIELTDGSGERTSDCKFTSWYFDTLSGQAKNIPSTPFDGYTLTFDDTLTGTIKIKVTEPTPFESTFMIGGDIKTTTGITPTTPSLPPAGYEDEILTTFNINPFPDTNINDLEGKAAAELYRRAVIGGFPDGEFKGGRNVKRAEAAKFLLLARGTQVQELANNGRFWDVKEGEWYVKFVMTAAQLGIISGYPDGSFKPADTVNTAEFLKMLTLAFNLPKNISYSYSDVDSSDWFAQYAGVAQKYNLFPKRTASQLQPGRFLSRNEVAVAIYQYLANR